MDVLAEKLVFFGKTHKTTETWTETFFKRSVILSLSKDQPPEANRNPP
jgi:hypothetical protein